MPTQSRPNSSVPRNIANAMVMKDEDIFLLCAHDGGVPSGNKDGFGLYYHDCRFLDGYEVRISGTSVNSLMSNAERGSAAMFELTNEGFSDGNGTSVPAQTFGIQVQRVIDGRNTSLRDVINIENYDVHEHTLPLSFHFESCFEDIFEIRGLHPKKIGKNNKPEWQDGKLVFSYDGADGVQRRLDVHPDPMPNKTIDSGAEYELKLKAGGRAQISLSLCVLERSSGQHQAVNPSTSGSHGLVEEHDRRANNWLAGYAEVESDDKLLDGIIRRGLLDLFVLRSSLDGLDYISAGLPWYGALFGRDSIIAALETLAFEPGIAKQTLRLLAKYQGTKKDEWRDEEPGKILHELRRGELAHLNEIPQTPYYGSVDSTPLFLMLVGEYVNWTGDLQLFHELRGNIDRALQWIDTNCSNSGGYLSYSTKSKKGLSNQGWKDSGDSIMNSDGSLAVPPIALVEVQGYVYIAKLLIAELCERSSEGETAKRLRNEAHDLKSRFNRDFWVADKNFYAIALQKDKRPAAVVSSNPGQALWTGIIDESRAKAVVAGLTAPDMFNGWGIRTLSDRERRANPIGYHLGTVWPHDNAIIAAGFRRYGFDKEANAVLEAVRQAASHFGNLRLPELFAGFSRKQFSTPVRYPVACHPQAWAAGSVPFLVTSVLGLTPDAANGKLRVVRPALPGSVTKLEIKRIKVHGESIDLRFNRERDGRTSVEVSGGNANLVDIDENTVGHGLRRAS